MFPATLAEISNSDDRQFMVEIYQKYHRLMYHLARKCINDSLILEDIVQDSLVKLLAKIAILRQLDDARLVSYIAHTVRNTAIKHLEHHAKIYHNLIDINIEDLAENSDVCTSSPEECAIQKEQWETFLQEWANLSDRERLLLEGKYLLKQSDSELAECLGCQPASVRMALTRARRTVLNKLTRSDL